MGFFGKSEEEMKRIAADLDKRQTAMDNRESELKSKEANLAHELELLAADKGKFETQRSNHASEVKRMADSMAAEHVDLEKSRSEITLMEAKAKANFADAQREAFKEVVIKRQGDLDARQSDLDVLAADVAKRLEALHAKEGDLARRELTVTDREQKGDAGFADKAKALADEATRQHRANQAASERLEKLAALLAADRQTFEQKKAELTRREQAILIAEQTRDAGFADERSALVAELREKRAQVESEIADVRERALSNFEDEIAKLKTKRLEDVSRAEESERERIRAEIAKEREAWTKQQDGDRKKLETERTELEKQKGAVFALQSEIEGRKTELETAERTLERKNQRLEQQWHKRNDELEESVESRLSERRKSMELAETSSKEELSRLRDSLRTQTELVAAFDHLTRQLGGKDPAEVILELNSQTDQLKRLREELSTRPTEEMRERYQALESEAKNQKARADELGRQIAENTAAVAEVAYLRLKNSELNAENKSLAQKASIFEGSANEAQAELSRLRAAYERPAEVEARYKEIELPHIKADKVKQPEEAEIDEVTWLKGVGSACENYGLHFNPRILKAFHTGLKTAEWSPLTILAGVSGTGKSELPRLYSHFGGIFFEPLSVQPNWDSQESMLGFFNSIDNKFDAQPLLRFLAQSQKKWIERTDDEEGYPGLVDSLSLVLLDEMNIAYPELYFAEFLSKLELRRGRKGPDVPFLPVKIGAGLSPYQLPLGRNVLWIGTMNQDETTKSLSDKVLDRSIIIYFPRPTELKRRPKLLPLNEENRGKLLHRASWEEWVVRDSSLSDEEVNPYSEFLKGINASLGVVGRAIGHRVWQSVEYYMANYPDVRAAQKAGDKDELAQKLHIAFEDQLVQKVMPKLRGIDTRGTSRTDCLDRIRRMLGAGVNGMPFKLDGDFALACELGYGQFIWQSANYLNEDDVRSILAPSTSPREADDAEISNQRTLDANSDSQDEPPPWFRLGDAKRREFWNKKSKEAKEKLIADYAASGRGP